MRSRRYVVILPHIVVLMLFLMAFEERLLTAESLFYEIRCCESDLAAVRTENERLKEELAVAEDPAALQEQMRRLGYIYPGETVYLQGTD